MNIKIELAYAFGYYRWHKTHMPTCAARLSYCVSDRIARLPQLARRCSA
jgi:hypothetical protein